MYSLNRKGPKLPPTMDPEGDVKAGEAGRPKHFAIFGRVSSSGFQGYGP